MEDTTARPRRVVSKPAWLVADMLEAEPGLESVSSREATPADLGIEKKTQQDEAFVPPELATPVASDAIATEPASPKRKRSCTRKARTSSWELLLPPGEPAGEEDLPSELLFPLADLPQDLLVRVLRRLPVSQLVSLSRVGKPMADASEAVFEQLCRKRRWLPPRRPRGEQAESRHFPWRSIYRRHACQACGNDGEFPVRREFGGSLLMLVCRRCVNSPHVRARLVGADLFIDLLSITGKRLIRKPVRRFCRRAPAAH